MMRLTLQHREIKTLAFRFYAADRAVSREARKLVGEMGLFTKELTQFFCPVDTWFMHDHVRLEFTGDRLGYEVGWLDADFAEAGLPFYPIYQEFGTSKMRAQPSLFPAYREAEASFRPAVRDLMRHALARALRRRGAGGR